MIAFVRGLALVSTIFFLIGCTTVASSSTPSGSTPTSQDSSGPSTPSSLIPTAPPTPPVDPSIAAVSASHPSAGAAQALKACGVTDPGLTEVAAMGQIAHARNAVNYTRISSMAPFIASDAPAWIVQFRGQVIHVMEGQEWVDQTCVVIGGVQMFFATGPVIDLATGMVTQGYWPADPTESLPALTQ